MKLRLTDGVKTVYAVEYKPLAMITSKLPPGTKLQLNGPMRVADHIIYLKPENIEIFGGEVKELLVSNAYENVVRHLLKQGPTDNPKMEYHEALVATEPIPNTIPQYPARKLLSNQSPRPHTQNCAQETWLRLQNGRMCRPRTQSHLNYQLTILIIHIKSIK
jgi:hypothetical protein